MLTVYVFPVRWFHLLVLCVRMFASVVFALESGSGRMRWSGVFMAASRGGSIVERRTGRGCRVRTRCQSHPVGSRNPRALPLVGGPLPEP